MSMPAPFRFLAKMQTRGPLADREGTPLILDGVTVSLTRDGRVLRAIVGEATVEIEGDYVQRRTASYRREDLPRDLRRGDVILIDGQPAHIETARPNRVGMVDCILAE